MDARTHAITIPDSFVPYVPNSFRIPSYYADDIDSVLIPEGLIRDRIKGVASEIFRCYATDAEQPEPLVVVCVLKSAFRFFCVLQEELMRLNNDGYDDGTSSYSNGFVDGNENTHAHTNKPALPLLCEFIRVKSYVNTKSDTTCDVQIQGLTNPQESFSSKNVLIIEDIIDSGRTMHALVDNFRQYNVKSLKVVSMLWKRLLHGGTTSSFKPDFYGFEIPDRFVIGFGLDYNEKFRDLNHLCIINERGIQRHRAKAENSTVHS